ncbi:ABC transporter ATP-binding protein [Pseudohongiella spirulinae]|uniref:ABC transporter (ATP-binding protein) n=1 Tax=Pseudohongiella spirulinae TaxID=1249552 RepID=A0A0S2KB56_9GAMM|nr:ABC transporter transmembrane domain-containing protein [Pseudohongiella spirulinae]ALO45342.1 ABC transporter (ATP-binding protein) [Pseudohongiella spirulinae]
MYQDDDLPARVNRGALWRLLKYALAYPRLLKEAAVLLLLTTLGQVLGPVLIKIFLDDHVTQNNYPVSDIVWLAGAYILLYGVSAWAGYWQAMRLNEVAFSVVRSIRRQVFSTVMRKPLSYFDHRPTGKLVSRITNDTEAIKDLFLHVLATFVQGITLIVAVFIAMAILDLRLMLICLIIMPVMILVMVNYQRLSAPRYHRARSILSQINASLSESISGMRVVQLINQQSRFMQRFTDTSQSHFQARMRNLKLDALLLRPMPDLLRTLTLAGVLLYFGSQSLSTAVEVGVIYAFINYLSRITEPVLQMTQRLSMLQQAVVAGERVFEILDEGQEEHSSASLLVGRGEVEFRDVSFSYDGEHPVLQRIDFKVAPGEFYAIVGHTGSGKSTLMSLLMRFYAPQSGEILLDGHHLHEINQDSLRNGVGVVMQDPFITTGSVRENITLGRDMSDDRVVAAARAAQLHDFVMSLPQAYDTPMQERGGNFSTGQRQLLSLARTLAHEPKVLILDEATANIDSHTEAIIQQALMSMKGKSSIIAIAHRLSTITNADQILVLHQGCIAQRGTHNELVSQDGLYRNMYLLQQREG